MHRTRAFDQYAIDNVAKLQDKTNFVVFDVAQRPTECKAAVAASPEVACHVDGLLRYPIATEFLERNVRGQLLQRPPYAFNDRCL